MDGRRTRARRTRWLDALRVEFESPFRPRSECIFRQRVIVAALVVALWPCAGFCRAANPADFVVFSDPTIPGRLYVPPEASAGPRPLILFLHGSGETGTNNFSQINVNIDNLLAGAKARARFCMRRRPRRSIGRTRRAPRA